MLRCIFPPLGSDLVGYPIISIETLRKGYEYDNIACICTTEDGEEARIVGDLWFDIRERPYIFGYVATKREFSNNEILGGVDAGISSLYEENSALLREIRRNLMEVDDEKHLGDFLLPNPSLLSLPQGDSDNLSYKIYKLVR